ncbi:serine protease inhibitor 88Ea-like isoform X2 [Artemia franciscana]|uniref:Serpin domain-containing protein n=2 Tax=Artemia franciscana TaxID=6661 RepID=A0AA88HZ81_ARTSF|nr:hypothetical protein QYM36_005414 [Artemia franciscana]KAK2719933.1 hypothetical protein QYM36_005414 [Artemia franciscana]KAK2719934.1 hypothetical protein QYM36_005414 [Artemia franciscana]KAK2719935.1 hypothetical protein QYM36_005414 [Artemia franciscana]
MRILLAFATLWVAASGMAISTNETEAPEPECFGAKQIINTGEVTSAAEFYAGEVDFSIDLFKKVYADNGGIKSKKPQNVFFSPFSVHSALLLAYFGSAGETQKNLGEVLRLGETDKATAIRSYKATQMLHRLSSAANLTSKSYDLELANKVFFDSTEPLSNCITEVLSEEVEEMDFLKKSSESLNMINGWVNDKTKGKIENFLEEGSITSETRMVLANAAYFKGDWQSQFKPERTKPTIFHISPSEQTFVKMMYQKGQFRHGVSEELMSYILELPYVGEDISMFILLPPFVENALDEVLSKLNGSILKEALRSMWKVDIEVGIPKFKIEASMELSKTLKNMGLESIFDPILANMTDFSSSPGLYFDELKHKAVVELNEEGSEAAAATALIALRSSRPLEREKFICNHPFIFMIYDNMVDSILFMGAYRNPKSSV